MKDHYKTGSKIHGLILFEKHAGNNAVDSVEKAVEQRPVVKEEAAVATKRDKLRVSEILCLWKPMLP